jgi:DNA (cytosine-5)-methyltransferase 1
VRDAARRSQRCYAPRDRLRWPQPPGNTTHLLQMVLNKTLLSAFTGAGGLDLGFEAAGFEVIGCIERDSPSLRTLGENRPSWRLLEPRDIVSVALTLKPKDLGISPGDLAILTAGPPCQPFSKAAQWSTNGRSGLDDPRALSLGSLFRLVAQFLPRVILLENVIGFVAGPFSAMPYLEEQLGAINLAEGTSYTPHVFRINAAHYGVPQRRERMLIVITRDGAPFKKPQPTHVEQPTTAWDALADIVVETPPSASGRWADLLPSIPEGHNYLWHTERGGGVEIFGYRTRYWSFLLKLAKSEPSWTIPADSGPSTGPFHWDNRPLSVTEALRLQTFPLNWTFAGSYRQQRRQVGNATPPLLAEIFARSVGQQVFERSYLLPPIFSISRRHDTPPPSSSSPVPLRYLPSERQASHPGVGKGPKPTGRLQDRLDRKGM